MNATIEGRLMGVLKNSLELENVDINIEDKLDARGINSITYVKLVVAIEEEFGIEFDDEDLDVGKFESIKSLISYIEGKI